MPTSCMVQDCWAEPVVLPMEFVMLNLKTLAQTLLSSSMKEAEQRLLLIAAQAGAHPEDFALFQKEATRRGHMWAADAHSVGFPAWSGEDYVLWARGLAKAAPVGGWYAGIPTPAPGSKLVHWTCTGRTLYAVVPGGVLLIIRAGAAEGPLGIVGNGTVQNVIVLKGAEVLAFAGPMATRKWLCSLEAAWAAYQEAVDRDKPSYRLHEELEAVRAKQDGLSEADAHGLSIGWEAIVAFRDQAAQRSARRSAQTAWERQEKVLEAVLGRPMPMAR